MENPLNPATKVKSSLNLQNTIIWILGLFLLLAASGSVTESIISSLLLFIAGIITLPPTFRLLEKILPHKISGGFRAIIIVILTGLATSFMPNAPTETPVDPPETIIDSATKVAENPVVSIQKDWAKVAEFNAGENKQSPSFSLEGGQQKLVYNLKGSSNSYCTIYLVEEGTSLDEVGGFPIVSLSEAKSDETLLRKSAGQYYFDLRVGNGSCGIELFEMRNKEFFD